MRCPDHVGAVSIAIGAAATASVKCMAATLARYCPELPTTYLTPAPTPDPVTASRLAKLHLDTLSPYRRTLYLDADTLVYSSALLTGFQILADGWDMVIVASGNQGAAFLAHSTPEDAQATRMALGNPEPLQLQAGVMWIHWNAATRQLWQAWRAEYGKHGDKDQGALLRALDVAPVRLWLLGPDFNSYGGAVIKHRFGEAR